MARTTHGNYTGRAASTDLREQREWIMEEQRKFREEAFQKKCDDAMDQLRALDPDGWDEWFENQPTHTLESILARVEELKEINELVKLARNIRSTMHDSIQSVQWNKAEYSLDRYAESKELAERYVENPPTKRGDWVYWMKENMKYHLRETRLFLNTEYTG